MQKQVFPFRKELVEFLMGIFALAVSNKEADSYDIVIDGLPVTIPTTDKTQIGFALKVFDEKRNNKMVVRFFNRHHRVREFEFNTDAEELSDDDFFAWADGIKWPGEIPPLLDIPAGEETVSRPELKLSQRTFTAGTEAAVLLGAAIGALDELFEVATDSAHLAEVRGQLLDSYEKRIREQQEQIESYENTYGKAPKGKSPFFRTFNGPQCAGVIINKAAAKEAVLPVMELIRFFYGTVYGWTENPKAGREKIVLIKPENNGSLHAPLPA